MDNQNLKNDMPFQSTYHQVIENMNKISEKISDYLIKLRNTLFNESAIEEGKTDVTYNEVTRSLQVIGLHIDDQHMDTDFLPEDYHHDITWELKHG